MKLLAYFSFFIVFLFLGSCQPAETEESLIEAKIRNVSESDQVVYGELIEAKGELPLERRRQLWSEISNDPKYTPTRRRWAVLQLFDYCIKPGMTLAEAGKYLAPADWLTVDKMAYVETHYGYPVTAASHESVVQITVQLPSSDLSEIYFVIDGHPPLCEVRDALAGRYSPSGNFVMTSVDVREGTKQDGWLLRWQHYHMPNQVREEFRPTRLKPVGSKYCAP